MSVLLKDPQRRLGPDALTVMAGLAAAEGIEQIAPADAALKWPNDVLLDGRKVCGVLVERRSHRGQTHYVIGIGVNASAHPDDAEVDQPACDLSAWCPGGLERVELARAILRRLDKWVCRLEDDSSAAAEDLRGAWQRRCGMVNQRLTVQSRGRRYTGRVVQIDPLAGLVLLTDAGAQVHVPAEGATIVQGLHS